MDKAQRNSAYETDTSAADARQAGAPLLPVDTPNHTPSDGPLPPRVLFVEVFSPEGEPVRWPFTLTRPEPHTVSSHPLELMSGEPLSLPDTITSGIWQLSCKTLPGRWRVDVPVDPVVPLKPVRLTVAELLVWLADPGGRDFGGIPVLALSTAGETRGRIGIPFPVWSGKQTLMIGNPVAGVALRRMDIEVRPARTTLELGRLGALVLRFQHDHGWPVQAHRSPLLPGGEPGGSPGLLPGLSSSAPVQPTAGHTNEPLLLWPGPYRVAMEEGPELELEIRGGQLTEVRLPTDSGLEALVSQLRTSPPPAIAKTVRGLLSSQARRLARSAVQSNMATPLEKLGIHLQSMPDEDADYGPDVLSAGKPPRGPGILLMLNDARGYNLAGHPYTLQPWDSPSRSQPPLQGRIGRWCSAPEGKYRLQLEGLLPLKRPIVVGPRAQELVLAPLAGLEVILRDGTGCSLRGASLVAAGEMGNLTLAFSQLQPLEAGLYRLQVPTRPPLQKEVRLEPGQEQVLDLGALGQVDTQPGPEAPWGTALFLEPLEGGEAAPTRIQGMMGQLLHVAPGTYRFWLGATAGEGETLEVRAGRMRRPTVVGRGMEALAHEDANRK